MGDREIFLNTSTTQHFKPVGKALGHKRHSLRSMLAVGQQEGRLAFGLGDHTTIMAPSVVRDKG